MNQADDHREDRVEVRVSDGLALGAPLAPGPDLPQVARQRQRSALWESVGVALAAYLALLGLLWLLKSPSYAGSTASSILQIVVQALMLAPVALATAIYTRRISTGFTLLWLRKFRATDRGKYRLQLIIKRAAAGLLTPITIQDRSYRASYLPAIVSPLAGPLAMLAVTFGMVAFAVFLAQRRVHVGGFIAGTILWAVLVGLAGILLARRLGYRSFQDERGPDRAAIRLAQIKTRTRSLVGYAIDVWKCSNENWQRAVALAIDACEIVLVDISQVNENIRWEIDTVRQRKRPAGIIWAIENGSTIERSLLAAICADHGLRDDDIDGLVRAGVLFVYPPDPPARLLRRPYLKQADGLRALLLTRLAALPPRPNAVAVDVDLRQRRRRQAWAAAATAAAMIVAIAATFDIPSLRTPDVEEMKRVLVGRWQGRTHAEQADVEFRPDGSYVELTEGRDAVRYGRWDIDHVTSASGRFALLLYEVGYPRGGDRKPIPYWLGFINDDAIDRGVLGIDMRWRRRPPRSAEEFAAIRRQAENLYQAAAQEDERRGDEALARHDPDRAIERYRGAVQRRLDLAGSEPGRRDLQAALALAQRKLGHALVGVHAADWCMFWCEQGIVSRGVSWTRPHEALQSYRLSLAIFETLGGEDSASIDLQRDLATAYSLVGGTQFALGQYEQSLASVRAGLSIRQRVSARAPDRPDWRRDLAAAHGDLGDCLWSLGRYDLLAEMVEAYEMRTRLYDAVTKAEPENVGWQREWALSHIRLALAYNAQRRGADARTAIETGRAIVVRLGARSPKLQADLRWLDELRTKLGN